jgi:hypothetical protein
MQRKRAPRKEAMNGAAKTDLHSVPDERKERVSMLDDPSLNRCPGVEVDISDKMPT